MVERDGSQSEAPSSASAVLDTLDLSGVHLALVSPEGLVVWASPSLVASRGSRMIGGPCHPQIFRRESDCVPCQREQVLATGEPFRCWIPERRPGRFGPRQMLVQMRTPEGNLLEAIIEAGPADRLFYDQIFRERVLSEGLRHVPAGVLLLDAAMRVVSANPAAARLLDRPDELLRGTPVSELLPPGSLPACGEDLAALLTEQAGFERGEVLLVRGDQRFIVHLSLAAVTGPDESLAAAVAILTDLTSERLVGQALARKLGEMTLLHEIADVLSWVVRLDQVLRVLLSAVIHPEGLGLTHAALFLFEESEGVVRGRLARRRETGEFTPGTDGLAAELERMARAESERWQRGSSGKLHQFSVPLSQDSHVLIRAMKASAPLLVDLGSEEDRAEPRLASMLGQARAFLAPLVSQGRRLGVLVGVRHEGDPLLDQDRLTLAGMLASRAAGAITRARLHDELAERLADLRDAHARQRYLQGQLLRAEKMSALGELAAEIVHQIRNPLAIVGGFARRLERDFPGDDPRLGDLSILIEEADRMETILERIGQDVRLARSPTREVVSAADIVGAALARYRAIAQEKGILLETMVDEGIPEMRCSREILLEVLDNLVRNAFDAVEDKGRVTVRARRLKDAVHLVVEDDGPGLEEEQLEKVFEPFYTTKARGTGLGLSLSRRLMVQSGASLSVDSRPGEGARFRIVIPVASVEDGCNEPS